MSKLPQPKFERTIRVYGSDLVRSVQYDPATSVLDAQLHTGDTYRYRDVTAQDFTKLVTTKSAGQASTPPSKSIGGEAHAKAISCADNP